MCCQDLEAAPIVTVLGISLPDEPSMESKLLVVRKQMATKACTLPAPLMHRPSELASPHCGHVPGQQLPESLGHFKVVIFF